MGTEKQVRRLSLTVPPERAGQKVDTLLRKVLGLSGTVIRRIKWLEDGILLDGVRVFTSLTVPPERAGQKVDTLLRKVLGLSGTVIRRIKWLEDGILLDGVRVFTSQRVEGGQVLTVRLSDPERRSGVTPAPGPLDIVYEDGDLLVLNKAPGVLVHPGAGHFPDTIGNFLLDYYDKAGIEADFHPVHRLDKGTSGLMVVAKHPHAQEVLKNQLHTAEFRRIYLAGIEADFHPVHRLDKGTSGLMVVAKHPHAQEVLKNQLHTAEFRRIYLAVCLGGPAEEAGTVDAPIGMAEGSIVARAVRPDGLTARTHYQVLRRVGDRALVRLALETGRTHQIRVHMAHLGCPLAGDFLYGIEDKDLIPRPALHSSELTIRQPVTGEVLTFTCPLPGDMAHLIELET